jgi:hypothetical protein
MMVEKLLHLDRRIIYAIILASVVVPLFFPMGLPISATASTTAAFEAVEKLPEGSIILMSADYGASTKVELHPVILATFDQAMRQNKKVAFMALNPEGQALSDEAIATISKKYPEKKYGVDFVNLGYKAGNEAPLVSLGLDFRGVFPTDTKGTPLSDIPMLSRVTQLSQIALVGSYSSGYPGALEHIRLTATQYGRPVVVVATAVMTPQYFPYFESKQIVGLVGGLRGAAEYENLCGYQGTAVSGMDAQSIAHFTIAGLILFSNLMSFLQWWGKRREEQQG